MSSRQHRRLFSTGTLKGTGRFPRPAGVLCPHFIVFANSWDEADADENHDDDDDDAAFELHVTRTRDFKPEEVGTPIMARETRRAIQEYLSDGGKAPSWKDMFVQIKCPLLTPERIEEAAARRETCATTDCSPRTAAWAAGTRPISRRRRRRRRRRRSRQRKRTGKRKSKKKKISSHSQCDCQHQCECHGLLIAW